MPTVSKILGLRVVIYPNDHRPAHVHVIGRGCEAMFDLHCPCGPPALRENFRFAKNDLNDIAKVLKRQLINICDSWRNIHGYH